jgi:uncharacterized protein
MDIISKTADYVQTTLQNAEGGHDWWHIYRVWQNAKLIAATEARADQVVIDQVVVELAALLHDIADSKFHGGDEEIGPRTARNWLESQSVPKNKVDHVVLIIENISFKGGNVARQFESLELNIVQDADRLDAIGAIGIARTFNYGGHKGREIYNPNIEPQLHMTKEEYKKSTAPTLNHFYEKLLLLKDLMNTQTGRALAQERHTFMETYLNQFMQEWQGKS